MSNTAPTHTSLNAGPELLSRPMNAQSQSSDIDAQLDGHLLVVLDFLCLFKEVVLDD